MHLRDEDQRSASNRGTDPISLEVGVKILDVVDEMRYFQHVPYNFAPVPELQNYLSSVTVLSEEALHQNSILIEPPGYHEV